MIMTLKMFILKVMMLTRRQKKFMKELMPKKCKKYKKNTEENSLIS